MLEIVPGNLLDAQEQYITHQANCVTSRAAHLAAAMFRKFPHADIYSGRAKHDKPGTIMIKGDGQGERLVIAMLGQYFPGKPRYPDSKLDGYSARQGYFQSCLDQILALNLDSIAFPNGVGCGAAGGDWAIYLKMIEGFASRTSARVAIYKLED